MIKSARFNYFRLREFKQFISNILMIVKEHGPDKLKIKAYYQVLLNNYESLREAHEQDNHNAATPQLAALDDRRDQAIISLRTICDGYTYHYQEKKKAAGMKVVDCIDKYGSKLYSLNYSAETDALKGLTHELLSNPECISALQEIHVEDLVKEIETANTKFEKLFVQRLRSFSEDEARTTTELKQLSVAAYTTLMQHIDAHATLAPTEEYTSLIRHINENVEHFNLMVERRKSGGEAAEMDTLPDASLDESAV